MEETNKKKNDKVGTWSELGIHPARLVNLVTRGEAEIVGHTPSRLKIWKVTHDVWMVNQHRK